MTRKKSFLKIGAIYTIGQVLSKAISFILVPIYTRELGTVGYGKLALADTVMDFISTFLIVSIFSGYIRFYREYPKEQRNKLRNTAINFSIIMAIINIILILLFGKSLSKLIFKFDNSYEVFILIVIRSLLTQFIILFMCDYSLNYEAKITVITNLVMLIMNLGLSIVFVVVKNQGIIGVYKGYIYSSVVILTYLIIKNIKKYRVELDKNMLKDMLTFSGGLIPEGLSGTILTLSDRYFLAGYRDLGETGIYSIGYKFGSLVDPIFISPFKSIFTPYKFEIWKDEDSEIKLNNMFKKYHFYGLLVVLMISIYSKIILTIFTTKEYIDSYKLIPLILFSYFTYGKSEFYGIATQIKNKTYINGMVMLGGGISNIVLNVILIPQHGMSGAAIATLISYLIINFMYLKISKKMYNVRYDFKSIVNLYFVTIILYVFYYLISLLNFSLVIEFLLGIYIFIIYICMSIKFKFIYKEDIKEINRKVKSKFKGD